MGTVLSEINTKSLKKISLVSKRKNIYGNRNIELGFAITCFSVIVFFNMHRLIFFPIMINHFIGLTLFLRKISRKTFTRIS